MTHTRRGIRCRIPLVICLFVAAICCSITANTDNGTPVGSMWAVPDSDDVQFGQMIAKLKTLQLDSSREIVTYSGSTLWSFTMAVAADDTILYALNRSGLEVFSVSDPTSPIKVDQIWLESGTPYNLMCLEGNLLCLGRYDRLYLFDVSDPVNLQELSEIVLSGNIMDMEIRDDRLYAGIGRYSGETDDSPALYILDIANPADPSIIGKYESTHYYKDCRRFELVGDYIYGLNHWSNHLDVISIADETNPILVWSTYLHIPWDVAFHGGFLYVQAADDLSQLDRIMVYDVSVPDSPVAHDSLPSPWSLALETHGDHLYVMQAYPLEHGVRVYEITSPGQLASIDLYENRTSYYSATFTDSLLFLPEGNYGFAIISVSDPANASALAEYSHDCFGLMGLDVSGDYAYLTNYQSGSGTNLNGLFVVDITDKSNPEYVYSDHVFSNANHTVADDSLLLMTNCGRTQIYSLTNHAQPELLSAFPEWATNTFDAAVRDSLLIVTAGGNGLLIGDIADPANPVLVERMTFEEITPCGAILVDNTAYVTGYSSWLIPQQCQLYTIDVSSPAEPVIVDILEAGTASGDNPYVGFEMTRWGHYIYLAGRGLGVRIIDIADRYHPDIAGVYSPELEDFQDVAFRRNYMFIGGMYSLSVTDVSNPVDPELVQFIPLSSYAYSLDVEGDYLYVACQHGFYVFEISLPDIGCGDANGSSAVDIDDAVWLIAYIFSGGPAPDPIETGDVDCSGSVDIDDVVYLITYIFAGGLPPCDGC